MPSDLEPAPWTAARPRAFARCASSAIGSQKIVPDLETAMARIEEHSLILEHSRMHKLWGSNSAINKILIIRKEFRPGRFTVVVIKEPVGA